MKKFPASDNVALCGSCLEQHSKKTFKSLPGSGYWRKCPSCKKGEIFLIDEIILPSIKMFIQKGYKTNFCCSGHAFSKDGELEEFTPPYVYFKEAITPSMKLPKGFRLDVDDRLTERQVIRGQLNYTEPLNVQFVKLMKNLFKWAESLPTKPQTNALAKLSKEKRKSK